tara:strand:+ start:43600 stop:44133 length:534 start_codon:yes stop_codon:yes gene_type:complete
LRLSASNVISAFILLAVSGLPVSAMSMEAQIKFDYIASVKGEGRWECGTISSDGLYEVGGQIRFQISADYKVYAPTLSFVEMDGGVYYNRGAMRGTAYETDGGEAVIDLTISEVTQSDPLPNGYEWSHPEDVRLVLRVDEEEDPEKRGPYSLQGTLYDNFGPSAYSCYEKIEPELLF